VSKIDLHIFKEDLAKVPLNGSNAPPRSIKAQDLDDNFAKTSVIDPVDDPPRYTVEYTSEGTRLKITVLPEDADDGALLYWDGSAWAALSPPTASGLHVLTVSGGELAWTATEACP